MSVHEAAKMNPWFHKAIVLTGDDVVQLTVDNWNTIQVLTEYTVTEILFSLTTPEQKMLIVEETKKRGDNVVAVVSLFSPFITLLTLFYCRLEMESTMHSKVISVLLWEGVPLFYNDGMVSEAAHAMS